MYASAARRPFAARSKRTRANLRREAFQTSVDVTEQVAQLQAETWAHLVDAGMSEQDADAVLKTVLRDQAGYRGTERLDWVRRQLAQVRAVTLAAPAYPQREA